MGRAVSGLLTLGGLGHWWYFSGESLDRKFTSQIGLFLASRSCYPHLVVCSFGVSFQMKNPRETSLLQFSPICLLSWRKDPPIPQSFLPSRVNAEFPLPVYFWVIAVETLQDGWVECGELIIKADMTVLNQKHILSLVFVSKRERKMQ